MRLSSWLLAAGFLGVSLAAPRILAQPPDGGRLRGGVAFEAGAFVGAGSADVTLAAVGVQGQLGAQLDDRVGVYAIPSLDLLFGDVRGAQLALVALVDLTFSDRYVAGIGPEVGVFVGGAGGGDAPIGNAALLYGGRLHFAYYPSPARAEDRARRRGLQLALDVRLLVGSSGGDAVPGSHGTAVVVMPTFSIGHAAF